MTLSELRCQNLLLSFLKINHQHIEYIKPKYYGDRALDENEEGLQGQMNELNITGYYGPVLQKVINPRIIVIQPFYKDLGFPGRAWEGDTPCVHNFIKWRNVCYW